MADRQYDLDHHPSYLGLYEETSTGIWEIPRDDLRSEAKSPTHNNYIQLSFRPDHQIALEKPVGSGKAENNWRSLWGLGG